jgi:hypothetical protein
MREAQSATPAAMDPLVLEAAVRAAKSMYPSAEVKVRRGRVIVVDGDLIRWIKYDDLDHRTIPSAKRGRR